MPSENTFKTHKVDNSEEITLAYPEIVGDDTIVVNATLLPYLYDATTISIENLSGLDLGNPDSLNHCWINVIDRFDYSRSVQFCMGTRLDEDGNPVHCSVFYDDQFTYDAQKDRYELTIFIPAYCKNSNTIEGFNESTVLFEVRGSGLSVDGSYETVLPPFILQGKAHKEDPSEEDPVFPSNADRCSIGEGTIPAYYENSKGYDSDYLFTCASAMYCVETSGFMPSDMAESTEFQDVSAYLHNSKTGSDIMLSIEALEPVSTTIPVMKLLDEPERVFNGQYEVTTWKSRIDSDWARENLATAENEMTVSASVRGI